MPLYEFVCQQCQESFESLVRSSNWKGTVCPHCGSKKLEKKLSTFAPSVAGPSSSQPAACPMNPSQPGCGHCGPGHRH